MTKVKSYKALIFTLVTSIPVFISFLIDFIYPISKRPTEIQADSNKKPIVLVHGHLSGTWIFYFLRKYLLKGGYKIYVPNYGTGAEDITIAATKLNEYIEKHKIEDFTLIGSSIGNIVVLKYLVEFNGWEKTDKFISVAGPFKGTAAAIFATKFSKGAKQILPNCEYVTELSASENIHPKKVVSIVSPYDNIVSVGSGTLKGSKQIVTKALGHSDILYFSKEVWEHIDNEAS